VATETEQDRLDAEDPLSRQLEEFFLKNIIPAVSTEARSVARSAAEDYIAEVRQETAATRQAVKDQLTALDERSANVQSQMQMLSELASSVRTGSQRQQAEVEGRIAEVQQTVVNRLESLIRQTGEALKLIENRWDELRDAAAHLEALHSALLKTSGDMAKQALLVVEAADRDARTRQGSAEGGNAARKRIAAVPEVGPDDPPGGDEKAGWRRWARHWPWAIAALALAAILFALLRPWPFGSAGEVDNSSVVTENRSAPPAGKAEDSAPGSVDDKWLDVVGRNQALRDYCKTRDCSRFDAAWKPEAGSEMNAERTLIFQVMLRDFVNIKKCPRPLPEVRVDGDFGPGTRRVANDVAVGCVEGAALPADATVAEFAPLARMMLTAMSEPAD
jgi:hypothetical protein